MLNQNYRLNLTRTKDRFTGTRNGVELELNKISESILEALHQNVRDRRDFIDKNDNLKRNERLGVRRLAEIFGVNPGTIRYDKRMILKQKPLPKK